jgi:CBS domain-containing protein
MTEFGFGSVGVVNSTGSVIGVFTDGDLRRKLQEKGREVLALPLSSFSYKAPITIEATAILNDAADIFKKTKVDTILVTDNGKPVGMLDIQDLKEE